MSEYPSILLEQAVNQMASLPGVGRRTALRLVLHLLRQKEQDVEAFSGSFLRLKKEVVYCRECHNISDSELCPICASTRRDHSTICVVENVQDVMSIENTGQYNGVYHVLHGAINPSLGIGPNDIRLPELLKRLQSTDATEVIIATNSSIEGETTAMYISKLIKPTGIRVTRIASGVPVGGELEYIDEVTLSRALDARVEL